MQGFVSQLIETHHESIFQSRWRCEWYASDARTSQPSRVQRGRTADSRYDRVQGGRIFPARCPPRHRENRRVPETHCARWRRHPRCRSPCAVRTKTRTDGCGNTSPKRTDLRIYDVDEIFAVAEAAQRQTEPFIPAQTPMPFGARLPTIELYSLADLSTARDASNACRWRFPGKCGL